MHIQVLVTTMHQSDTALYQKMNLQTDAIIANQADCFGYQEETVGGHTVKMITTATRGLSRNRNIALGFSSADYIAFSDDDLIWNDNYPQLIAREFEAHPEAEAIKFNIHDLSATRKISMRRIERFEKATRRNMSSSGVCGLVVRADVLKRLNLHFHENFGTGTENYCGEDTIFLMRLLDHKVRLYRSPVDVAGIDQSVSSWFRGHNAQYFTNCGKLLWEIYPVLACLLAVRSAWRFSKRDDCDMSFLAILRCYYKGMFTNG